MDLSMLDQPDCHGQGESKMHKNKPDRYMGELLMVSISDRIKFHSHGSKSAIKSH